MKCFHIVIICFLLFSMICLPVSGEDEQASIEIPKKFHRRLGLHSREFGVIIKTFQGAGENEVLQIILYDSNDSEPDITPDISIDESVLTFENYSGVQDIMTRKPEKDKGKGQKATFKKKKSKSLDKEKGGKKEIKILLNEAEQEEYAHFLTQKQIEWDFLKSSECGGEYACLEGKIFYDAPKNTDYPENSLWQFWNEIRRSRAETPYELDPVFGNTTAVEE